MAWKEAALEIAAPSAHNNDPCPSQRFLLVKVRIMCFVSQRPFEYPRKNRQ